jgi:cytochrome P450
MKGKTLPGPKRNLIFLNFRSLLNQPLNFLSEISKEYPGIVYVKALNRKMVLITDPVLIRYILQTNQKQYTKGSQYKLLKHVLGNGLVTSEGDLWRKQRKLIQPAFHKQYIHTLFEDMLICANQMVEDFKSYAEKSTPVYLSDEMMKVTLHIIGKTMLSADVTAEAVPIRNSLIFIGKQIATDAMKAVKLPIWFPTASNIQFKKEVNVLDKIIYRIIDERRNSTEKKGDLLDMLMDSRYEDTGEAMPNDLLRDEIMTIFIAGHSTTATALAWTFYLISQNPEVYKKLKKEIDEVVGTGELTFQHLQQLHYSKACFNEAMRLYPPVWLFIRRAAEDNMVGDYLIEKDTDVLISPFLVHRNLEFWKDAYTFNPDRWDTEEVKEMDKFTYFPFAAGPRMCIGNNFALFEADIIIAKVIQQFKFDYLGTAPAEMEPSTTLRVKDRMPMKFLKLNEKEI